MKIPNCERGGSQVDNGFPGVLRIIVADPIHEIVEPAVPKLGVEDLVNLELGKPVHLSGQRRGHDTARERVRHVQLEQANMEHRMDLHGSWRQRLVGRFPDGPDDWVGYNDSEHSWEPAVNLAHATFAVRDFHARCPDKPRPL